MKSKLLFAFAVVAAFAAVLLSGCGKTTTTTTNNGCLTFTGTDTGIHKVYLNGLYGLVPDIQDTLTVSKSGTVVNINSKALKDIPINGSVDASDCNKVNLDSIIFVPGDTLVINSATLGRVTIYNVRAGGTGTISTSGILTSIKIAKGNTNLGILPNLSNVELKGTFKTLP